MRWVLADTTRVRPGVHPDAWDGSALVLQPGVDILHRIEPLWRQISLVNETAPPEVATTRLISLFSRAVEIALPTLLADDGAVHDAERVTFLEVHLAAILDAIDRGVPVRGYFYWSLLDNFEWGYGYAKRFGIVRVDFDSLEARAVTVRDRDTMAQERVPLDEVHAYLAARLKGA